jgi:MFS family permease
MEVLWAIITFCFAAVTSAKQVYAMRFLIGLFESPFYVGAMTLLGNWYTPAGKLCYSFKVITLQKFFETSHF